MRCRPSSSRPSTNRSRQSIYLNNVVNGAAREILIYFINIHVIQVSVREKEVRALVSADKKSDALRKALENPPLAAQDKSIKVGRETSMMSGDCL